MTKDNSGAMSMDQTKLELTESLVRGAVASWLNALASRSQERGIYLNPDPGQQAISELSAIRALQFAAEMALGGDPKCGALPSLANDLKWCED